MREILFKAKRIDNGEWVEGALFDGKNRCVICQKIKFSPDIENECKIVGYIVDRNTLCQFTGFFDKNEKKIWEHDIARDTDDDMTMVVRWDDEKLKFVLDDYGYTGCMMEYGWDETAGRFDIVDTYGFDDFCSPINKVLEVIGNIFDNAELLKG